MGGCQNERNICRAFRKTFGGYASYDTRVIFGSSLNAIRIGKNNVFNIAEIPKDKAEIYRRVGRVSFMVDLGFICTSVVLDLSQFPNAKYLWINRYEPERMGFVVSSNESDKSNITDERLGKSCLRLGLENGQKLVGVDAGIHYSFSQNNKNHQKRNKPYSVRLTPLYL